MRVCGTASCSPTVDSALRGQVNHHTEFVVGVEWSLFEEVLSSHAAVIAHIVVINELGNVALVNERRAKLFEENAPLIELDLMRVCSRPCALCGGAARYDCHLTATWLPFS